MRSGNPCRQFLTLLGVMGLFASAQWAQAVEVRDVRLWRAPDHTRIVLDLSAPVQHKLIELPNPERIVLDLSEIGSARVPADSS